MSNFKADYRREPGIHVFTTADAVPVTAISVPDWGQYIDSLRDLPPTDGYIVSPELVTSPWPLDKIKDHLPEVRERMETVRQTSRQQPETTILLGTATTDKNRRLRNSLAVIQNGEVSGYVDKRGTMWPDEARIFSQGRRAQAELRHRQYGALICSDMVTAGVATPGLPHTYSLLAPDTKALLVSSCWAIPKLTGLRTPVSPEERYRQALERTIVSLFTNYSLLRDIIVVDRAIPGSGVEPYTGHFRRIDS